MFEKQFSIVSVVSRKQGTEFWQIEFADQC